jgi:hypothetical protein
MVKCDVIFSMTKVLTSCQLQGLLANGTTQLLFICKNALHILLCFEGIRYDLKAGKWVTQLSHSARHVMQLSHSARHVMRARAAR